METQTIGALIFIAMIVGVNLLMYGFVRAWAKPGAKNPFEALGQSFNAARKKEDAMDELRRTMEELEKGKKE